MVSEEAPSQGTPFSSVLLVQRNRIVPSMCIVVRELADLEVV